MVWKLTVSFRHGTISQEDALRGRVETEALDETMMKVCSSPLCAKQTVKSFLKGNIRLRSHYLLKRFDLRYIRLRKS